MTGVSSCLLQAKAIRKVGQDPIAKSTATAFAANISAKPCSSKSFAVRSHESPSSMPIWNGITFISAPLSTSAIVCTDLSRCLRMTGTIGWISPSGLYQSATMYSNSSILVILGLIFVKYALHSSATVRRKVPCRPRLEKTYPRGKFVNVVRQVVFQELDNLKLLIPVEPLQSVD